MGSRDGLPLRNSAYDRARDLPRLLPVWPGDLADISPAGLQRSLERVTAALRRERQRGLARHWSYDLSRHRALAIAAQEERALLQRTLARNPRNGPRLAAGHVRFAADGRAQPLGTPADVPAASSQLITKT